MSEEQEPIRFPTGARLRFDAGGKRVTLFQHRPHPHRPRNVNAMHKAERLGLNARIAVFISRSVGTMVCAYVFAGIGIASLTGALTGNALLALTFGALSSYFLQLVLLPIIMVGQNVQARHSELQAEEAFQTTQKSYHDIEEIMAHLSAQDVKLLEILERLEVNQKG